MPKKRKEIGQRDNNRRRLLSSTRSDKRRRLLSSTRSDKRRRLLSSLRSDNWLLSHLDELWNKHFSDIPQTNRVYIKFGRFAKYRLGSIRLNRRTKESFITITAMFKNQNIPAAVVDHTIGHELTHYAHGFSSINPRLHKYPHAGGVVRLEMQKRGMEHLNDAYKDWVKEYRKQLLDYR